ncbi:hypothetical protein [uncultured Algimonas sp.]|uniref:hypothetical protein n=1 Tax=uncultured Algimonas sp. TaxID=1547920 RepID=UPI0026205967|nr:hypothetical protein [uncultured Algimonas sp.]
MKSATLIDLLAEAYKIERKTIALYDRHLKEAGYIPKGRGRHAPAARPEDAALLTLALLATDKPAKAVQRVERFRGLQCVADRSSGAFPDAYNIQEGTTIEDALTAFFASDIYDGSPYVEVHENARTARIEFFGQGEIIGKAFFRTVDKTEAQLEQDRRELLGIRQMRGLASSELLRVHVPFYLERREGVSWEEMLPASEQGEGR